MRLAAATGVDRQVTILPYVPDAQMRGLYRGATGLVMPTFFSATHIPVLEAWALKVPVITSDLPSPRAQAGDAALFVDPREPATLAEAMLTLWDDRGTRDRLIAAGTRRAAMWTPADFSRRLGEILERASVLARADGGPRPWIP
jgi:glycosyltransferase involved in cell wall biosynthesis